VSARAQKPRPQGRPPRTDNPRRATLVLPGDVHRWLRVYAAEHDRDMSDVVTEALRAYSKAARRTAARRER
jgi:hypothetical protein